jgi:acyl-CoA synthetase (NDP forming)
VVADQGVRLRLLYMEAMKDPATLAAAARAEGAARRADRGAQGRRVPASGQKAASSHTGALASEDRVSTLLRAPCNLARDRPE